LAAVGASAVVLTAVASSPARAVDSDSDTVDVNVNVGAGITIDVTTASFALAGLPGALATTPGAVALRVFTNNPTGYTVAVEPTTPNLTGPGSDVIPTDQLQVRDAAVGGAFANLTPGSPLTVNTKGAASVPAGDQFTYDYQLVIPAVVQGTYTGTLNYIATTQ
jgi:hypothetical protein